MIGLPMAAGTYCYKNLTRTIAAAEEGRRQGGELPTDDEENSSIIRRVDREGEALQSNSCSHRSTLA